MTASKLTDREAGELGRFSQGRARIQAHLNLLRSRAEVEPFARFVSIAKTDASVGSSAFLYLNERLEEVKGWMLERDQIENEVSDFDVADMEMLRDMAKDASQRPSLSSGDTDIVEVALETIISLEQLRAHLKSRATSLSLYHSRLIWDMQRRECWDTYTILAAEADAIVTRKAQWCLTSNHTALRDSVQSVHSRRNIGFELFRLDAQRLFAQIRKFVDIQVPNSGVQLDRVIEQLKVPEEFIDEQDRIDALAESIESQHHFLNELLEQWKRADELYNHAHELHIKAKILSADVEKAKNEIPSADTARSFMKRETDLSQALEDLCGPSARRFLDDPERSSRQLRVADDKVLPTPFHTKWPAQEAWNTSTLSAISDELAIAGKRIKQAAKACRAYSEITTAYSQAEATNRYLRDLTAVCTSIKEECCRDWEPVQPSSKTIEPMMGFDWTAVAGRVLSNSATSTYDLDASQHSDRICDAEKRFREAQREGVSAKNNLIDSRLRCQSLGLSLHPLQHGFEDAVILWDTQQAETEVAVREARSLSAALILVKLIQEGLVKAQELLGEEVSCLSREAEKYRYTEERGVQSPVNKESHTTFSQLDSVGLDSIRVSISSLEAQELAATMGETLKEFRRRLNSLTTQSEQVQLLAHWILLLSKQSQTIQVAQSKFEHIYHNAQDLKQQCHSLAVGGVIGTETVKNLTASLHELTAAIKNFTSGQMEQLMMVGVIPVVDTLSVKGKPLQLYSPDEDVIKMSNTWCLMLAVEGDAVKRCLGDLESCSHEQPLEEQPSHQKLQEFPTQPPESIADAQWQSAHKCRKGQIHSSAIDHQSHEDNLVDSMMMDSFSKSSISELTSSLQTLSHRSPASSSAHEATSCDRPKSRVLDFPSPTVGDLSSEKMKSLVDRDDNIAARRLSAALDDALHDCGQELARREKSFFKMLISTTSRRLPLLAFISELSNRRSDAEERLALRMEMITTLLKQLEHLQLSEEASQALVDAESRTKHAAFAVKELLKRFDEAIANESEGARSFSSPPSNEKLRQVSASGMMVSSLSADFEERIHLGPSAPAAASPFTAKRSSSASPPRCLESKHKIAELMNRLNDVEVEAQTVPDGLTQMRAFLELPTLEDSRRTRSQWASLQEEISLAIRLHASDSSASVLSVLSGQKAEKVDRYVRLANFSSEATKSETALSALLELLDQTSDTSFAEILSFPLSSAHSQEHFPKDEINRDSLRDVRNRGLPTTADGKADAQLMEEVRKALEALEPVLERTKEAAQSVLQDARVKERLMQINRSYVDLAEMASDVLSPSLQRCSSTSSAVSLPSQGDSCVSLPASPVLGMTTPFTFARGYASSHSPEANTSASLHRTGSKMSTPAIPRPRRKSLATSKLEPPTATAMRIIGRRSLAHKAISGEEPRSRPHRVSAEHDPSSPNASTSRSRLPNITGSPATPADPPLNLANDSDLFNTPTPSRIKAPSAFARPASTAGAAAHTPSKSSSLSIRRPSNTTPVASRPNRYRANPKSKLDVAIGQTINRLPVPVKMEAVKTAGSGAYEDYSGNYLVGYPEPRLCFCRILRSRTIMVRVGGGWQELTRYLMKHHRLSMTRVELGSLPSSPASPRSSPRDLRPPAWKSSAVPWISSSTSLEQVLGQDSPASSGGGRIGDISSPILLSSPESMRRGGSNTIGVDTPTKPIHRRGTAYTASPALEIFPSESYQSADNLPELGKRLPTSSSAEKEQAFQLKAPKRFPSGLARVIDAAEDGDGDDDGDDSLCSMSTIYFRPERGGAMSGERRRLVAHPPEKKV